MKAVGPAVAVAVAALVCCSCGGGGSSERDAGGTVKLQGAGASFPAPLYRKWFKDFSTANAGAQFLSSLHFTRL